MAEMIHAIGVGAQAFGVLVYAGMCVSLIAVSSIYEKIKEH